MSKKERVADKGLKVSDSLKCNRLKIRFFFTGEAVEAHYGLRCLIKQICSESFNINSLEKCQP